MLRASSVLPDHTVPVTFFEAQGRVQTAFGPARASEPQPIRLPRDSGIAQVMARIADRAADEAFQAGRFEAADRLAGLVLELQARATGERA